jgi:serine/threonine protein kinase
VTPDPQERAKDLYLEVVELPEGERDAFLNAHCKGDEALRTEVERLLDLERRLPKGFLAGASGARPTRLERGTSFAGFRILGELGEGGMGTVYVAEQSFPRRDIALKVVRPDRLTASALQRFETEVQALGSLQHPGIAQIYGAGTAVREGGATAEPYLAMELVRGAPIVDYATREALGSRERMELVARVADALHHAHQRGILHRDLKPDNVLVAEGGTSAFAADDPLARLGQPKVLDFGIARFFGESAAAQTRSGELIGTLSHMSPEQLAGDSSRLDERTDVYALGVMLYQLLAGRLPHDLTERSVPEAIRALGEEARPLEALVPQHRGDVATIAARALDPDPEQRYPSAAALAEDLRRHLRGEPIHARSHSTLYILRRSLRRHRVVFLSAAGLIAVVLIFGFVLRDRSSELNAMTESRDAEFARTLASLRLIADAADGMDEKWGASAAQRRVLESVLESHLALLAVRAEDLETRLRVAVTTVEVAEIQALLGDYAAARDSSRRAIEMLEALGADEIPDTGLLVVARLQLTSALTNEGDFDGARRQGRLALERCEATGDGLGTVRTLWRMAKIEQDTGRFELAKELGLKAIESADALDEALQELAFYPRTNSENVLCLAMTRLGDYDGAIERLERLYVVLEAGREGDQLCYLVTTGVNLGRLYFDVGRAADSERVLEKAVAVAEELLTEAPEESLYAYQLMGALNNLAAVYGMTGRDDEAGPMFERALEIVDRLIAAQPSDLGLTQHRDSLLTNAGAYRATQGDGDAGRDLLERARENWTARLASDPGDQDASYTLAITLNALSMAHLKSGEQEATVEVLAEFPALTDLDLVGRALSIYSMLLDDVRADSGSDTQAIDDRAARYVRAACELLGRCTEAGFSQHQVLRDAPHFTGLRNEVEFAELLELL